MQTHPLRQPKRSLRHRGRGLACCAVVGGLYLYATLHPKVTPPDLSQATISHIIDETEPLCRTFAPDKNTLRFSAHPSPTFRRSGAARDLWAVECRNNEGKEIVHVLWDEDTKRCISISQTPDVSTHNLAPKLNRANALSVARNWITRLNIADAAQAANAPGELRVLEHSYRVFLRMPDGMATVWIDAHTGECFHALVRSYADTSTMQAASPPKQEDVPHS